jgi:hypothetical protein
MLDLQEYGLSILSGAIITVEVSILSLEVLRTLY